MDEAHAARITFLSLLRKSLGSYFVDPIIGLVDEAHAARITCLSLLRKSLGSYVVDPIMSLLVEAHVVRISLLITNRHECCAMLLCASRGVPILSIPSSA